MCSLIWRKKREVWYPFSGYSLSGTKAGVFYRAPYDIRDGEGCGCNTEYQIDDI